jgi:acetamidase/formamidase
MKIFAGWAGCAVVSTAAIAAPHAPETHRLEATPSTVAYGYYWAEAAPVLRIASGDIIDVDTLLTNTPAGLAKAGVPDNKIQASLKAVVSEVTGDRKGPGGHILTGPVYVEGAEPGDVLEVKILSIDLAIDYGYCAFRPWRTVDPGMTDSPGAKRRKLCG